MKIGQKDAARKKCQECKAAPRQVIGCFYTLRIENVIFGSSGFEAYLLDREPNRTTEAGSNESIRAPDCKRSGAFIMFPGKAMGWYTEIKMHVDNCADIQMVRNKMKEKLSHGWPRRVIIAFAVMIAIVLAFKIKELYVQEIKADQFDMEWAAMQKDVPRDLPALLPEEKYRVNRPEVSLDATDVELETRYYKNGEAYKNYYVSMALMVTYFVSDDFEKLSRKQIWQYLYDIDKTTKSGFYQYTRDHYPSFYNMEVGSSEYYRGEYFDRYDYIHAFVVTESGNTYKYCGYLPEAYSKNGKYITVETQKSDSNSSANKSSGNNTNTAKKSTGSSNQKKKSTLKDDPYDAYNYDDPDDFADEWAEEFEEKSFDDGYDAAWDYWEEHH